MLRLVFAALLLTPLYALAQETAPAMTGDVRIHDPAVIVEDGKWVSFQTGRGGPWRGAVLVKTSPDGIAWTDAGGIGKGPPAWAEKEQGYRSPEIWAPSASKHDGVWYLYYSASSFGINQSVIGVMTHDALDLSRPGEGWVDQGLVLKSTLRDDFNAIDAFRIDLGDGRAFLSYGSYWTGIKLRELDPKTGKLIAPDTPVFDLASRNGGAIEASSILEHDGKFYLFVSFDRCCAGADSTYRIMVGRADDVTGPYLDRDGKPMMDGNATEIQASLGRFIGPGGQEPVFGAGEDLLAYHYYDGGERGISKLQIAPISWDSEGWPVLAPPPG